MKHFLLFTFSLLIALTSFSQATSVTQPQQTLTKVTIGNNGPMIKKRGQKRAIPTNAYNNQRQSVNNLQNSFLNLGIPSPNSPASAASSSTISKNTSNFQPTQQNNSIVFTNKGPISTTKTQGGDGRNLPLNKDGKLLSVDGNVVEFNVPQSSKTSTICSSPMPKMFGGDKNPACGFIVARDNPASRDAATVGTTKYFQLRWLVFTDGGAATNIDQARIDALMAELNADYAAHNMIFCADPATFLESATWYTHNSGTDEFPMKNANNVTPTQVINIYVVGSMTSGGYARMPYDPSGGTSTTGGIVLNRGNCSVGTHTLAHEMGHTFGLFHTFNGVSEQAGCGANCYERVRNANGSSNASGVPTPLGGPYLDEGDREGDWCSDTNPHPIDNYLCPGPVGTAGVCDLFPRVPANFPVNNHMSYSFCSSIFTTQQAYRMHGMVDDYLSSWTAYGGGICGAQPPVADFVGTPTSWIAPNLVDFTDLSTPTAIITSWTWTFDVAGSGTVTCAGCVGANATFVGQTPPTVTYPNVGLYTVSLTVGSPNGSDTETKVDYIEVLAPSGECDTLDTDWLTPAPTVTAYNGAFGFFTGVPAEVSTAPADPAGFYQQYFTPTPGVSIVGALTVALGNLIDADGDMTVQVVVYEDDAGNPGFPDWGAGPVALRSFSPTQLNVPGAGFFNEFNIPFTCAPTIAGVTFHVGVEMFPGDATDQLVLFSNVNGQGGSLLTNTYAGTACPSMDYNVGGHSCGYGPLDFDLYCYPQMGWYTPTGIATGFNEDVVCDTSHVTIYTATLYDGDGCVAPSGPNLGMVNWTYTFGNGTVVNSPTEIDSFNFSYTQPGPETLTIVAINDCGRADTASYVIPYNFLSTPDAEFTKVQGNPICMGAPGVDFNANTTGYQDYTWDFGDGTVQSSGDTAAVNHVYTTPGLYYTSLTVTSTGYQPIDVFHFEDFQGGWPAGYLRRSNDAFTPNAFLNPPWTGSNATAWLPVDLAGNGNVTATSTSYHTGGGQQADDWMATSAIGVLPANQMLTWDALAENFTFADGYEVRISTTAQAPANVANYNTVLFSIAAENSFTTRRSVSLASYAGQTVYIAFRNNSTDEFLLSIDNIWVGTTGPGCSATITKLDYVEIVDCSTIPPTAAISSVEAGCIPLTVTSSDATIAGDPATSWFWNFGDGTFSTLQNPPPHVYATNGTYFVSLQVCNAGGCSTAYQTLLVDCVLPIELLEINAECSGEYLKLNWQTGTEINNDVFVIERSVDLIHFDDVATLKGGGNQSTITNYQWVDDNPVSGTVYYRLKQVDFNGMASYSKTIHANCEKNQAISIYPNPAQQTLYLEGEDINVGSIEIFNVYGQIVNSKVTFKKNDKNIKVDIFRLSNGIYFLKVGNRYTAKFIKEI
jgi:PKD repeat protein